MTLLGWQTEVAGQYCTSGASSSADSKITEVILAGSTITLTNNSVANGCETYSDHTSLPAANLQPDSSYSVSVSLGTCNGDYNKAAKVFIDWNADYDFDDAGEGIGFTPNSVLPATYSISFTAPLTVSSGNKRMRIVCMETGDSGDLISSCGTFGYGETEDYTVLLMPSTSCDLAAQSWISPIANSSGLTSSQPVTVEVFNSGTQSQANFTVAYSINNGVSYVTETVPGPLASGATYTHTFATNADFSATGNYSCIFQVSLACDANTVNNSVAITVNNASQINTFPYVEYFTGATSSWTTGGASNTWQYGVPAGSIITSAASEPYCWVTNLTGNYNNYENSWVESPFINFTSLTAPILEMKLFYITENNYDGAAIEYSLDGGLSWTQMGYYQDPYGLNWYNNTYAYGSWPNIPKWSGASGGWITVKYKIYENPVLMTAFANQTVKFRVAFRADSSGYNEGIAFDNFSLYNAPEFDAELLTILNPYAQAVGNTALDPGVIIKNQGTSPITSCTISYQIDGGAVTNFSYSGSIASTMTDTVTLPSFTTAASGNQSIKAWVSLTGDPLQSNDTLTGTFAILPYSCNYAMSFDGTNDWVEILDDTTLNSTDYTIEAWVKPSSFGWLKGIVSRYMPGGNGYVLRLSSTSPYSKVNFNEADANYTLSTNTWYHLAAVNQNGVNTLYINGVAFAVAGNNLPNTSGKIAIGNDYMERWWNGLIDEVRLWKTALTAAEINDWMSQPVTNLHPEWSNMAAYFNFDQPAGVAYDTKSNHDGIIHGAQFVASDLAFICEDNDAWLNAFVSPQGQSVEGNSLTPVVIVKNMGFNTINSLTVSYTVNGGAINTYNYSGSIQTAMVDTLTLPSFVSGSGTNTITAWVTMANDANASNDTLETSFTALPIVCNYALDLPGTSQYAKLPAGQYFSNNFTVEAWVYKRVNNYSSRLIDFGNGTNNNVLIQLNDGSTSKVRFSIRQGTTEQAILSNTTIPLNQWVHIACSYDGVAGRIYINGVEDINGSIHNPLPVVRNDCYIGKSNWTGDGYANMIVDEFKFWNTTLLPATIQTYMNVPPSAGHPNFNMLNFYYDFNSPVENPVQPIFGGTSLNLIGGLYSTTSAPVVCDPYDAAITNIISPAGMVVENQLTEPIVLLTNLGVQDLTNAQIYYTFGIDTLSYTYSGILYLGQTDTVALPGIMTPGGTTTTLCAWVEIPNDANSANDKTCRTYNIMLNACNYALYFDGSGDYVTIPVSPETEQLTNIYTLECWFKPEEFGFLDGLISKYQTSAGSGFQLRMGQTSPYTSLNFDEQTAGPVLVANQWYHVAAVNNNGQHKLYVNGVEYLTSASATYNPNNTAIKFGVDYGDRWFKGYMDDVRIWKAALTQADVQAWMQHTLTSSHPEYVNLVGHWEFDDLAPSATDSKANHHGSITNAVYKPSDAPVACGTQDAGVISFLAPGTTYFTGNYNALTVNVYNYGTDPITSLDMYYTVNNGTPVTYTFTGNIPSLGTQAITLPPFIGPAGTSATIMVSTDLAGDAVSFNDAKSKTVTATAPYEVALLNLAGPAGGCGLTDQEQLQFTIKNNGDSILSDLVVSYMSLPDSILHTELVTDTIMPLQQFVYTFNGTSDLYVGTGNDSTYSFKAWITLPGDAVATNNTITFSIESVHASDSPTGTDTTVVFGSTATLHGYSPYTVYWFEEQIGGTSINQGQNYTSPPLYDTTTYWIEASASMPYEVTIGTGTSASGLVPAYGLYNYSWSSTIYKAVDIGASMTITSFWLYVGNSPSNYAMNNQKIYMKHTTNNTQPNNLHPDFGSMQAVYEGNIIWNGGGWKQIVLTTPFNYNGIDNLEIGWQNYDGSWAS
ncbi:MAG: hypothetical protein K9I34_04325, partial [Bacteroidales bacterium]|nr:hypothetical protein [Bacteroidales bacterium]